VRWRLAAGELEIIWRWAREGLEVTWSEAGGEPGITQEIAGEQRPPDSKDESLKLLSSRFTMSRVAKVATGDVAANGVSG